MKYNLKSVLPLICPRKSLLFLCLSVASAVVLFPSLASASIVYEDFDSQGQGVARTSFGWANGNGSGGMQNSFTDDAVYVSAPYSLDMAPVFSAGEIYYQFASTSSGFVTMNINTETDANFEQSIVRLNGAGGTPDYDELAISFSQRSGSDLVLCGQNSQEQIGTWVIGTWYEIILEWRPSASDGTIEARCGIKVSGTFVYSAWRGDAQNYNDVRAVSIYANAGFPRLAIDNFYLSDDGSPESVNGSYINSVLPAENEVVMSTSSITIESVYSVDSSVLPEGAIVEVTQYWESIKDPSISGTFSETVGGFNTEQTFSNVIAEISATGTVSVHHSVSVTTIDEGSWWEFWQSDLISVEKIATDDSKFYVLEITSDAERRAILDARNDEDELADRVSGDSDPETFVDNSVDFMATLMGKHPFAWPVEAIKLVQTSANTSSSSVTFSVELPLFSLMQSSTSTDGFLDFEQMDAFVGATTVEATPLEDGCDFLNQTASFSTSTTLCGGFREMTGWIFYMMTIVFVGFLLYRLLKTNDGNAV